MSSEDKEAQENEIAILTEILDQEDLLVNYLDGVTCGHISIKIPFEQSPLKCQYLKLQQSSGSGGDEIKEDGNNGQQDVATAVGEKETNQKYNNNVTVEVDTISFKYLPPLVLHFTLPSDYPSAKEPMFTLSCQWIGRKSLSKLCAKLDNLWKENEGMGILFTWYTFLQDDLTTVLNIGPDSVHDLTFCYRTNNMNHKKHKKSKNLPDNKAHDNTAVTSDTNTTSTATNVTTSDVVLPSPATETATTSGETGLVLGSSNSSPQKRVHAHTPMDSRAVFERVNVPIHEFLINFEKEEQQRQFLKMSVLCEICYLEKRGSECLKLDCTHIFCKSCLKDFFTLHITEGSLDNIKCPGFKCQVVPFPYQVQSITEREIYERYDRLLLSKSLDNMEDVITCPRVSCGHPVVYDPESDKLARCLYCDYSFCRLCKKGFHGLEPCRFKSVEAKKLYDEYSAGTEEEKKLLEKRYGKKQLEILVEQTLSEEWVSTKAKNCPHCKVPIQKFEGCNKVTCFKCSTYFCWICSAQLSHENPYFHFNDPSSKCYNNLFENENNQERDNEDDWDEESSDSDEDEEALFQAGLHPIHVLRNRLLWLN